MWSVDSDCGVRTTDGHSEVLQMGVHWDRVGCCLAGHGYINRQQVHLTCLHRYPDKTQHLRDDNDSDNDNYYIIVYFKNFGMKKK